MGVQIRSGNLKTTDHKANNNPPCILYRCSNFNGIPRGPVEVVTDEGIARLLIVASLAAPPGTGHAMKIEQMKQLRGADLLELRVDELFAKCGLPDVVVDHGRCRLD